MDLSLHFTPSGPRWAAAGYFLSPGFDLAYLLGRPSEEGPAVLAEHQTPEPVEGALLAPIDPHQEVWASGVTYLRSRVAREAESATADIYSKVYDADRPELFFKTLGWRVIAPGGTIRVRADSNWNVPEPELVLLLDLEGKIRGYTAGNDVSSREIEGENPLYLPQAKVYNGSCALGPVIRLIDDPAELRDLSIQLEIEREGKRVFEGETGTKLMKRSFGELASYLFRELHFPDGAFLLTGTGIVPAEPYTLLPGDTVRVIVSDLVLENQTGA